MPESLSRLRPTARHNRKEAVNTMKIKAALIATTLALLVTPAAADASWTITQNQATRFVKQAAYQQYGVNRYGSTAAACSPKGQSAAGGAFVPGRYHSWVCGWAAGSVSAGTQCSGAMSIKGVNSAVYGFQFYVLRGARCGDGQ